VKEPSPYFIRRTAPLEPMVEPDDWAPHFDEEFARVDLTAYWRLVRKHLGLIAAVSGAVVFLTMLHVYIAQPMYTAQTTIMIQPRPPTGLDPTEALIEIESAYDGSDYFKTQTEILRSETLAAAVIRNLGLQHDPAFVGRAQGPGLFARMLEGFRATAHSVVSHSPPTSAAQRPETLRGVDPALVGAYLGGLSISSLQDTSLVTISFTAADPGLAARIANAHAEAYVERGIELHSQAGQESEKFLRQKLIEIKDQLEKSEIALNDYRRQKGIIPGLMSLDGKDTVVLDRLSDLSKDLTKAQVERIGLESQIELVQRRQYASLPQVMGNSMIQGLQEQLNQLYAQDASLSNEFTSAYPPLAELRAKEAEVNQRLVAQTDAVVRGIQSGYQQAVEKERELEIEMQKQRSVTMSLNDAAVQYAILQRDVDTNRELYNAVLTRMKDVGVESESQTSNVSIVDRALPPGESSSPRKMRDLMLSAVLGLCGAIGLALLLDYMDNTLKDPEEAERYLRIPNLGVIPDFARANGSVYRLRNYAPVRGLTGLAPAGELEGPNGKMITNGKRTAPKELVTMHGAYSALGEAYRNLRTALLLSRAGAPPKVTLVTSAVVGEGKTVTAVNTAAMLAQLGASVLLIDADLRRPRCHRVLGIDNNTGLTEVLTGVRELADMVRPSGIDNLFILSSGSVPPNATELLGSPKMNQVITLAQQRYDYVVVDSAPVLLVSDALLISAMVDGVLLVTNASGTPKQQVRAARARLDYARAKVFGLVLNRFKAHHSQQGYLYHQGYYTADDDGAHRNEEAV